MSVKREKQKVKTWGPGRMGGGNRDTRSEVQRTHLSLLHSDAIYQVQVPLEECYEHTKRPLSVFRHTLLN